MMIYVVKCTFIDNFWTSKFNSSPLIGKMRQEKVKYLKRKPFKIPFEGISIMRGSTQVLVKVVLFQLRGHGHPQDDAPTNSFANSKCPILGLSNEVSFVPELL